MTTAAPPATPDRSPATHVTPLLQKGGIGVLLGILTSFLGGVWDIHWHEDVGPDTFFTAPHLLLYLGAMIVGFTSLTVVLLCTERGRRPEVRGDTALVPILWGTFRAPIGFVVSGTGAALFLLAGLYDQWWHGLYGFDAVLDSPPHTALGLGDVTSIVGAMLIMALLLTRTRSAWPLMGLGTAVAIFLANSASWQLGAPVQTLGGINGQLLFIAAVYVAMFAAVSAIARRAWAATTTAAIFTGLAVAAWIFSVWATPAYAEAIGLFARDDAQGFPGIIAVLPKFVLPAAIAHDAIVRQARRSGRSVRSGIITAAAVGAVVVVVPELLWQMGATVDPVAAPIATAVLAVLIAVAAGWFGWKLGIVFRALAEPGHAPRRPRRPSRVMRTAVASLLLVLLMTAPAMAAPAVSIVHTEPLQAGPYRVDVGFSEWPIRSERSLDIVFRPDGGIDGIGGTVTTVSPAGEALQRELVRHPRMRDAFGLDIVALPGEGTWSLQLALDGAEGPGEGQIQLDLLARPGPALWLAALPVITVGSLMLLALAWGFRVVSPGRRPEATSWA